MKKYNLIPLKEQAGDDRSFFNEMLDIFIHSSLEGLASMDEACFKKDLKRLGHFAHKTLSPCRYIEAEKLSLLLKEIESRSEDGELTFERAGLLLIEVRSETEELIKDLKSEYL